MKSAEKHLDELRRLATRAAANAYSPYSLFPVGAAVMSASNKAWSGCNVENASFGLTQCAERAALTAAICDGARPGSLTLLVLYTPGDTAHAPCGACRQVMHELMAAESLVVSCCDSEQTLTWSDKEYLPDPFTADALSK